MSKTNLFTPENMINHLKNYCCYDCKHLKIPFDVDELGVPRPTNPYCKLGYDKNFKKYQDKWLAWINHAKYEMEICKHFKLKLSIRLHLRKIYNEANKMTLPLSEKEGIIIIPKRELDELKRRKAEYYAKKPLQVLAWQTDEELYIKTLEGVMKANKGDYIIQGVKGEYYPCKPDVFHETYTCTADQPEDVEK